MNRKQTTICWIGLLIFVLMGLFPPWIKHDTTLINDKVAVFSNIGYGFLFSPPRFSDFVDLTSLFTQWILVAVITAWFVYRAKE